MALSYTFEAGFVLVFHSKYQHGTPVFLLCTLCEDHTSINELCTKLRKQPVYC